MMVAQTSANNNLIQDQHNNMVLTQQSSFGHSPAGTDMSNETESLNGLDSSGNSTLHTLPQKYARWMPKHRERLLHDQKTHKARSDAQWTDKPELTARWMEGQIKAHESRDMKVFGHTGGGHQHNTVNGQLMMQSADGVQHNLLAGTSAQDQNNNNGPATAGGASKRRTAAQSSAAKRHHTATTTPNNTQVILNPQQLRQHQAHTYQLQQHKQQQQWMLQQQQQMYANNNVNAAYPINANFAAADPNNNNVNYNPNSLSQQQQFELYNHQRQCYIQMEQHKRLQQAQSEKQAVQPVTNQYRAPPAPAANQQVPTRMNCFNGSNRSWDQLNVLPINDQLLNGLPANNSQAELTELDVGDISGILGDSALMALPTTTTVEMNNNNMVMMHGQQTSAVTESTVTVSQTQQPVSSTSPLDMKPTMPMSMGVMRTTAMNATSAADTTIAGAMLTPERVSYSNAADVNQNRSVQYMHMTQNTMHNTQYNHAQWVREQQEHEQQYINTTACQQLQTPSSYNQLSATGLTPGLFSHYNGMDSPVLTMHASAQAHAHMNTTAGSVLHTPNTSVNMSNQNMYCTPARINQSQQVWSYQPTNQHQYPQQNTHR